ncbi:thioredoxin family protein [Klebsiella pneumoniae]|nr:thioredoxin family protein [Klebsiella pneumoniae]
MEHAGKLKVYKVNVDKHPDLASQHGIRTIPFLRSL